MPVGSKKMANCIFCKGRFGRERKRTTEHAFPKWIGELLHAGDEQGSHLIYKSTSTGLASKDVGYRSPFTDTVRQVCEPCNNGWMHELEDASKAILARMILGGSRDLRYWRQVMVAAWAIKTAMVLDFLSSDNRAFSDDLLESFHETQRPSLWQQVWIGSYADGSPHTLSCSRAVRTEDDGPSPKQIDLYTVTFSVGQLAFHIVGHSPGPDVLRRQVPKALQSSLIPIWPPEREVVSFPPTTALKNNELLQLLQTFGPLPHVRPQDVGRT
jgi:hypothetical protein